MNVKKFFAPNSRDALRLVREALGPDAVILSNRSVNGGVELLALANEEMAALAVPVLRAAVTVLRDMGSFADLGLADDLPTA